jgi:5-methyltetrahydropteroyltriglutamate--homocysteine methyltransferase
MFATTIVGSLPKPHWLAEPTKLWAPWRLVGGDLETAKRDATILAVKMQEDCGIDIITDGEQSRQHYAHAFLEVVEGVDFTRKVEMGIRADRYKVMVPTVTGALRLRGRAHGREARIARAHTGRKLKFNLPGPMTMTDTIANAHYRTRAEMAMAFAGLVNEEARALEAEGVDIIQFDEPAFAVYICYGYGIKANIDWKATLGTEWRHYEAIFPALKNSRIDQVSIECRNSRVPMHLLKLLDGKDIMVGAIDVATDVVETPEQVVAVIAEAMAHVAKEKIIVCTNCGMVPMGWDVAFAKLAALSRGAALARQNFGVA